MNRELVRVWGPVALVVALLPFAFVGLRSCLPPIGPRDTPPPEVVAPAPPEPAPGGTAVCAECHAAQRDAWSGSTHAKAESAVPADVPWTVTLDGAPAPLPVRAIGVAPLMQFLVPFPNGRLQVTQQAWDPARREAFDVFADGRGPGEWGHWTGGAMTWNGQCAPCHSTGVTVGYDAAADRYATTVTEHGVGCTACHGALADHSDAATVPKVAADACGPCHARRAELTGNWRPGDPFLDHFAPQLVDRTDAFWPDGQVREEDFEYTAFLGSKPHDAGVQCTSCHDPHTGGLRAAGDALCRSCHGAQLAFEDHDRHETSVGCIGCHMPVTTYMQRDPRHDHGFTVPDPTLHAEYGIPDACSRCHADHDVAWTVKAYRRWFPDAGGPRRDRAVALARGHRGDPEAVPGLLSVLKGTNAGFRAAAADLLGGYLDRDDALTALRAALADPDGHVRFAAVGALGGAADDPAVARDLAALLKDPLRAVRVQAARALRGILGPTDPSAADYVAYLALNADAPAALVERGTWALEQGRVPAAVADLAAAVKRDPRSAGVRDAYATALAQYGRAEDAASELRTAVDLAPDDAGMWFRLGLAEAGTQRLDAAEAALAKSVALDAADARAWYNLGLVRQARGEEALTALRKSAALAPDDPDPAYAIASALWNAGDRDRARDEAKKVLQLAPHHDGALAMLRPEDGSQGTR